MMIEEVEQFVLEKLKGHEKRIEHTYGVVEMALFLNEKYNLKINKEKIILSGLLHDAWKYLPEEEAKQILLKYENKTIWNKIKNIPSIWHGNVASILLPVELKITDKEIINAIKYHSTGKIRMSKLQKIIFISDYIEKNRIGENFTNARKITLQNLNEGLVFILKSTYEYLKSKNYNVYPDTLKIIKYYEGEKNE